MTFPTSYASILERINHIDPVAYGRTRNFSNGKVSYLSPYISRGVISTKLVFRHLLASGVNPFDAIKFIQELAWRDYWQQVWIHKGYAINSDLKQPQEPIVDHQSPIALLEAKTGVDAIDEGIETLYATGYMHNHMRMYVASLACNIAKSHWKTPAQWMYYHLLDGDWASNALSWQWVAGSNASKKYYVNQENINTFFYSNQKDTFLDKSYEEIASMDIPELLQSKQELEVSTVLPYRTTISVDASKPSLIYNYYNLDPLWRKDLDANRVLLLEPSFFDAYPVSPQCIDFLLALTENIADIKIFVGEYDEFVSTHLSKEIYFKEHPTNTHYRGTEDPRDWMFGVSGYFPSFFAFWKQCEKEMEEWRTGITY